MKFDFETFVQQSKRLPLHPQRGDQCHLHSQRRRKIVHPRRVHGLSMD